ncbi:MAG: protein kinase [Planctomycetota bacterium]
MASIVCVESSPEQGAWIAAALGERGHDVTRVRSEDEAARLFDAHKDLWVVGGDHGGASLQLVARLRKLAGPEQLPILYVTARDTEDAVLRAHGAGASAVLTPPLSKAHLVVRARKLLEDRTPPEEHDVDLAVGELYLGRYRIESFLGRGGNAVVFVARDERSDERVAIKIAHGASSDLPEARQRLQREAYALLAVDCAYTPVLHEFGRQEDGREYMVLELIEGENLWDRVTRRGPLSADDTYNLLMGLALALDSLEAYGLIHRDLKPGNVILRDDRPAWPVLVDFGLARKPEQDFLTDPDVLVGTTGYMAPEYVRGQRIDFRADLFSLGHVVRFAATGESAWPELCGMDLLQRMARETCPIPESVPAELRDVLQSLVEVDPARRPQSAAALLSLLEARGRAALTTRRVEGGGGGAA